MTAEVALAFQRTARAHTGHEVVDWEPDWQAAERIGLSTLVPDGHLGYRTSNGRLDALVEVDLGTEGTRFFVRKISRYLDLYRSGAWRAHFPTWPVVLTVTLSPTRATSLRRATEGFLRLQHDVERLADVTEFDFTSLPELRGADGPLGAIWQVAGRVSLHGLLPVADEDTLRRVDAPAKTTSVPGAP